ncbi:L-aspartate oxidase [Calidifontibacillus erzurumensis]|uniref:L-aspartate oxidase n=1 Tax=Calidifontibacillus erzurumensis TaxID=2741433 RepID=A0A8J8GBI8_9BACI|nr:L-aspartate oxidase [Calidifontibacillus erzurumensis]NSL50156.1 L-aspartate oxidase [Calidifontibacillus erzurumensis]
MADRYNADVVIIGSGIAALVVAERLSRKKNVIIITKSKKEDNNSNRAQGGVAAAISKSDHWLNHFEDTMIAGNYHNDEDAVQLLVEKGAHYLNKMIEDGMEFDKDANGNLLLGQEGAHGRRRILHAGGDATGQALVRFMLNRLQNQANVKLIEDVLAVDFLIQNNCCYGVKVKTKAGAVQPLYAADTILAAGGCGGLFEFTSNDPTVTGDGIAMAYRAGANLVDLEFVQFHPTLLYVNGGVKGLVSEAVRGEGAVLITQDGRRLMQGIHPQEDLAPRDIVAREIHRAVLNGEQIFLDISMIKNFAKRFPTITEMCRQSGIDLNAGKIPVVPGAHFQMGGVQVNLKGQTSIDHLYAIGEVACTGVHGANRLASNSLLEGIVFANELADYLLQQKHETEIPILEPVDRKLDILSLPTKEEIQAVMMKYVGIIRNGKGLQHAKSWFEQYLLPDIGAFLPEHLTNEQIEIYNMVQAGWLITTSALEREESRGGHFRIDFPEEKAEWTKKKIIRNCLVTAYKI